MDMSECQEKINVYVTQDTTIAIFGDVCQFRNIKGDIQMGPSAFLLPSLNYLKYIPLFLKYHAIMEFRLPEGNLFPFTILLIYSNVPAKI